MSSRCLYTPSVQAGHAARYGNICRHEAVKQWLPIPLANIVAGYSFIDPRVPEAVYSGFVYGKMKTEIARPDGLWAITFTSDNGNDITSVDVVRDRPGGLIVDEWYCTIWPDSMCAGLLDGDEWLVETDIQQPVNMYVTDVINGTRDWLYNEIINGRNVA